MNHQFAPRRVVRLTMIVIWSCSGAAGLALAQTTQPVKGTHAQFYANASRTPVIRPELRTSEGKPLSPEQQAEIDRAQTIYDDAVSLRESGDFATSFARAAAAAQIRADVLGPSHHLSVSAAVLALTMQAAEKFPDDQKRAFGEADRALREWSGLQLDGRYEEARRKVESVLSYAKERLAPSHPLVAWAHLRLGTTLIDLGEYDAAYDEITKSVALLKSIYGLNHPSYADSLDRLGWINVYRAITGSGDEKTADAAVESLERAVRIYRATIGETRDAAESLDNLGTALVYVKRVADARDAKLRALFIRETVLGPDARDTGVSLSNIAWMYGQLGAAGEALPLRERALDIFRKQLRPDHPYVLLESSNLAWDLHLVGRNDEAIKLYTQIVEHDRRSGGSIKADAVQRLVRLAQVYSESGKLVDAKRTFAEVKTAATALKRGGFSDQAMGALNSVSRAAFRSRMYQAALEFAEVSYEWSMEAKEKVSETERSLRGGFYGSLLHTCGRTEDAKRVLTVSMESLRSSSANSHIQLAEILINLARVEAELGELAAAERHADEAMQIAESKTGRVSLATAFTKLWYGNIHTRAGHYVIAQFTFEEAQEVFDQFRQRDPAGAVLVRIERAKCFVAQSKQSEAMALLREGLQICRDAPENLSGAMLDATTANLLRALYDTSRTGDATNEERAAWKSEAIRLLEELDTQGQLMAEEKAWVKANR